jgi:hypothetical protein
MPRLLCVRKPPNCDSARNYDAAPEPWPGVCHRYWLEMGEEANYPMAQKSFRAAPFSAVRPTLHPRMTKMPPAIANPFAVRPVSRCPGLGPPKDKSPFS